MAHTETVVTLPILHPERPGKRCQYRYMGKVDRVEDGTVEDWKSTANIKRFIANLRIGFQIELYSLALEQAGEHLRAGEYRLVTRPSIKFSGVDKVDGLLNRDAYEERCLEWLQDGERVRTLHYIVTDSKLNQAKWYLWNCAQRIRENKRTEAWLPNPHACFTWGKECAFLPLCDTMQNGGDVEWLVREYYHTVSSSHPELTDKKTIVINRKRHNMAKVLTFSSCGDLTLCELLYFWKHVRNIRKGAEPHDEALWVGSAMHAGMDCIDQGLPQAMESIDQWARTNPVLGEDAKVKQDQAVGRSRAMVRAAADKWDMV